MTLIKPPALQKGQTIGVMAPSSVVDKADIENATQIFADAGYQVFIHPQTYARDGQFAGTVEEKLSAFHELIKRDDIHAIIFARGGNGCVHLLNDLDFDLIKARPKIIMGFSDHTTLLNAITLKTGLITFHGPVFKQFANADDPITQNGLKMLAGFDGADLLSPNKDLITIHAGNATGSLYGGTMSQIESLMLSGFRFDFANSLFLLEEIMEEESKLDRVIGSLFNNPEFRQIKGLIFGKTKIAPDTSVSAPFTRNLQQMLEINLKKYGLDIPVVMNAPFGHMEFNNILPIGAQATLDISKDQPRLEILESPFSE